MTEINNFSSFPILYVHLKKSAKIELLSMEVKYSSLNCWFKTFYIIFLHFITTWNKKVSKNMFCPVLRRWHLREYLSYVNHKGKASNLRQCVYNGESYYHESNRRVEWIPRKLIKTLRIKVLEWLSYIIIVYWSGLPPPSQSRFPFIRYLFGGRGANTLYYWRLQTII